MKPVSYYTSEGDIAYIRVRPPADGGVTSEERPWGVLDYSEATGDLVGIEVWSASKSLPADLVAALPKLEAPEDLAEPARRAGGATP